MINNKEQNKLLETLGLESLPEEIQMDLLTKMSDTLYNTIMISVVEKLGQSDRQKTLGEFLEQKPEFPEFLNWCEKNVPEFEKLAKNETQKYIKQLSALESQSEI